MVARLRPVEVALHRPVGFGAERRRGLHGVCTVRAAGELGHPGVCAVVCSPPAHHGLFYRTAPGIHDYWQKVLTAKYREGQTECFAKRGMSVHGTVWIIPIPPPGAKLPDTGELIDRSRFEDVASGMAGDYEFDNQDFIIECHRLVCDDAKQGSWHGLSCQEATEETMVRCVCVRNVGWCIVVVGFSTLRYFAV